VPFRDINCMQQKDQVLSISHIGLWQAYSVQAWKDLIASRCTGPVPSDIQNRMLLNPVV
jgi:hypothetical protein